MRPVNQRFTNPIAVKRALVDAPPAQRALSMTLALLSAIILGLLFSLVAISPLQHWTAQNTLFDQLRLSLAEASTPIGPLDVHGKAVMVGTPVAVMSSKDLGISREVIVEGTAGAQTMLGIGHQRNTAMPCQFGTSVMMARSGSFGGIGRLWSQLSTGQLLVIKMGQGSCIYKVLDQRLPGAISPPPPTGRQGRLVLTTAAGASYMPTAVLRIDAELVGKGFDRPAQITSALPSSELPMGTDPSNLFGLVLLLEVLIAAVVAATWLWKRWGRWQTWIVAAPVITVIFLLCATCVNQIVLPNLL